MFCHVPFTDLHVSETGDVNCCCPEWLPTPLGNLLESSLEEIWHGPVAEAIRSSVLDGSFRYCTGCAYLPKIQGPITEQPTPWAMEKLDARGLRTLVLDYDLTCNLACPSCRLKIVDRSSDRGARVHELVLSSKIFQTVDRLMLSGSGDPLASPTYWKLLKDLPVLNPRLVVSLLTNGLLLDESHWSALGPARDQVTTVGVSIDASTPETYRKNRGGSWEKLWRNLDFVRRLRHEGRLLDLSTNYVVQANNFREVIPFARLAIEHEIDHVNFYFLRNWGTFSPSDYQARAVHLPAHPDHSELRAVLSDPRLTGDPRVVLPTLPTEKTP